MRSRSFYISVVATNADGPQLGAAQGAGLHLETLARVTALSG